MKNNIIKIVLGVIIIVLGFLVINSIMAPVKFENEKTRREQVVIEQLKEIREVQIAYKGIYNRYTGSFDTLIDFIKNGQIPVVNIIPDPSDTTFIKTINDTIGYVLVVDTLFKKHTNYDPNSLRFIPFSEGQEFELAAGKIEISKTKVNVFEVKALYIHILKGLDKQLIINLRKKLKELEKYEGLKVGSMEEASTDGNWEF
jgi:hypothetical protein